MTRARTLLTALAVGVALTTIGAAAAQPQAPPPPRPSPVRPINPGRPTMPPMPPMPPPHVPKPAEPLAEKAEAEHECHGNYDHPAPINWYQGLFGINNEKALKGSGLEKLLYRYNNEKDECDPKNQNAPLLAQVINFSIFAFLLVYFGRKPILAGLKKRKGAMMGDIEAAEALRSDAELRLKSYQKQLVNIGSRRTELEEEYQAQSEAERKRILAEADEKRARMIKDAEFRVQQELRQAQGEILREAIEAAVRAAEDLLKKSVGERDQERLADEYLAGLGAALTKGAPKAMSQGGGSA